MAYLFGYRQVFVVADETWSPPGSPVNGEAYLVFNGGGGGPAATGAWATFEHHSVAIWSSILGAWMNIPRSQLDGWAIRDDSDQVQYFHHGTVLQNAVTGSYVREVRWVDSPGGGHVFGGPNHIELSGPANNIGYDTPAEALVLQGRIFGG